MNQPQNNLRFWGIVALYAAMAATLDSVLVIARQGGCMRPSRVETPKLRFFFEKKKQKTLNQIAKQFAILGHSALHAAMAATLDFCAVIAGQGGCMCPSRVETPKIAEMRFGIKVFVHFFQKVA